jgi:quercetin dioxygenase-like cupin family protein
MSQLVDEALDEIGDTDPEVAAEGIRLRKTRVEVVQLEGFTIGRFIFEPGWRWSECLKPVVKTDHCQVSHVGYAVSGKITVRLKDGRETAIVAGQSYTIPPGHDAWVEGDEPFVAIEVMSADIFAKPQ